MNDIYIPEVRGHLKKNIIGLPEAIGKASGIRINGRILRSFIFTTDVATIRNNNADAIIAVYPFVPQPIITQAIVSVADVPVFCGIGSSSGAGGIKRVVKSLKYGGKRYLADILADEVYNLYLKTGYSADIAVFVPMVKAREKKRGYNQSRELARAFCSLSGVPLADNAIIKKEGVVSQVGLTRNARLNNLRDSFKVVDKTIFKDKKVIIIDDVATTGSTAETLSAAIMRAGAEETVVFTAAVAARSVGNATVN